MLRRLLSALGVYKVYRRWLRMQIDSKVKPEHIGVILDGNRRWASARHMIPWEGHREGAEKVKQFLEWCIDLGIKTVTLYGFSTENFQRSKREVEELMKLYEENLREVLRSDVIHKNRVCIKAIGRINLLPERIQQLIREVEEATKDYDRFYLNVALAYGGRAEIVDAAREIASKVKGGELSPEEIDEAVFEKHLYTSHLPQQDPDLIIRTSGESRLSGILHWQSAYSELFFVDVYWPEFREIDLERAIRSFQQRQRRFGK
ncbi:di-trans,poly-cis-decaprenylcistransferase [Candidatus Bathyarchaeota archaeon]|nr:MAG: di-trans,poly-cis-decaprenylcistransferase [Candidatus Bathyarchaeota archaeon]